MLGIFTLIALALSAPALSGDFIELNFTKEEVASFTQPRNFRGMQMTSPSGKVELLEVFED